MAACVALPSFFPLYQATSTKKTPQDPDRKSKAQKGIPAQFPFVPPVLPSNNKQPTKTRDTPVTPVLIQSHRWSSALIVITGFALAPSGFAPVKRAPLVFPSNITPRREAATHSLKRENPGSPGGDSPICCYALLTPLAFGQKKTQRGRKQTQNACHLSPNRVCHVKPGFRGSVSVPSPGLLWGALRYVQLPDPALIGPELRAPARLQRPQLPQQASAKAGARRGSWGGVFEKRGRFVGVQFEWAKKMKQF